MRVYSKAWETPATPSRLTNLLFVDTLWVKATLGNILTVIRQILSLGKRLVARDVTFSGSHVVPHLLNIGHMRVYVGMWKDLGVYDCV